MTSELPNADHSTTVWCAGLPFVGDRALTEEERHELDARVRAMQRLGLCLLLGFVLTLILIAAVILALGSHIVSSQTPSDVLVGVLILLLLLGVGAILQVYFGQQLLRYSMLLKSGRNTGILKVFQGVLSERLRLETTQNTLLANHRLRLDPHQIQTVELFAASGLLWRVNGVAIRRGIRPLLKEVATPPTFAAIAAQWLEPVGKNEKSTLYGGRRELSVSEKRELETFIRQLTIRPTASSLPLSLLSLGMAIHLFRSQSMERDPMFWFFVTGGISNLLLFIYQMRQARRFGNDLKVGYVGIRRIIASDTSGITDGVAEPDIEFLPVTGMLWTKSGEPAVWRRGNT